MKFVCIGDSLTYGYGVPKGKCWVDIIRKELKIEVINKGSNGDRIADMLSRSFIDVVENRPNVVTIMGGTNDFLMGYNLDRVKKGVELLVNEAREFYIIPIIGIQIPVDENLAVKRWSSDVDYSAVNKNIEQYRKWVIDYCNQNDILYVDFYKTFNETTQFMCAEKLYIDGLHPTEYGHQIMSQCITEVIF